MRARILALVVIAGLLLTGLAALAGSALNAAGAIAFAAFLQLSAGSFADVGYYFDPTHPTKAMADAAATVASQAPLLWLGAVAVGAIVPLAAAFLGRRTGNWKLWAPAAIIAAQTPVVDTISGATYTSNGIMQAVINALAPAVVSGTLPSL